ncbi:MAG: protein kinase [Thermoanaerobaculia bacterium]|nr:protein kinase [Thermoanaerobaculia bacterium]
MSSSLRSGTRLGPYEITAKLGEGGMGVVFRAKDAHLGREVAVKVLPEGFTADAERAARFEREAKVLASLNHPNIAQIYGLEIQGDTRALVMELVEGPTLAERLESGALPFHECLSVSLQIARALEEAHEKGIVHRDLKPQNIKASIEGKVKVLDFGLAKAMDPAGAASGAPSASQLAASPTLTLGATVQGMILGTAAYMAPEQARGAAVDRRADIWAFGVVLYEMLTGETLFAADTVPDTLARVLTREADLSKLSADVPPAIRALVRRCLVRQPKDRLHSIADARIVLEDVLAGREESASRPAGAAAVPAVASARRWLPWIGGALAGLLLGGVLASRFAPGPPRSTIGEASIQTLVSGGPSVQPSLAPDGKTLAFSSFRNGEIRVWIKDLVSGSESAIGRAPSYRPHFSPDGTSLLFERPEGERIDLYRLSLATREERLVARDAENGAWSPDGGSVTWIRRIRATGDAPSATREIVSIELGSGREQVLWTGEIVQTGGVVPAWSPDGQRLAIAVQEGQAGVGDRIGLLDLERGKLEQISLQLPRVPVIKVLGLAWISERRLALLLADGGGYLGSSGRIATFDIDSKRLRSLLPLQPVGDGIAVAGRDSLVVSLGSQEQSLFELARTGAGAWSHAEPRTEGPYSDRQPVYSPDGRWLLFSSNRSGNLDLWRLALDTGEMQRLTDHPAQDWDPAMSADGKWLLFSSNRSGRFQIWMAEADGSSPRQVTDVENAQNPTMTSDGAWIVYTLQDAPQEQIGIWKIRPDGRDATQVVRTLNAFIPESSPDGRFVAFNGAGGGPASLAQVVRLADGAPLAAPPPTATRFRWSVEGGETYLWAIVPSADDISIRRFAFDPERGVVGPGEVVAREPFERAPESLGVARDGSAITFSRTANERTQIVRVDGLGDLDSP